MTEHWPAIRRQRLSSQSQRCVEAFALVDMLIALALTGVIASLMLIFLGQARSIMRITKDNEIQIEVDSAASFLEDLISTAEPLPLTTSKDLIFLAGSHDSLELVGIQPTAFGSSSLRQIAVGVETSNDGALARGLVLQLAPRRAGKSQQTSNFELIELLEGPAVVAFEYLDAAPSSRWSPEWASPKQLPAAVRFTISVKRNGADYRAVGFARLVFARSMATQSN